MFTQISSRFVITGVLEAITGLHIGSGDSDYRPNGSDNPVLKDHLGQPFIPGSSIKGVLRSFVERLDLEEKGCYCGQVCSQPWNRQEQREEYRQKVKKQGLEPDEALARQIDHAACPACRLFGSPVLSARVKIADAHLAPESAGKVHLEQRMGVQINRDTRTAQESHLYNKEVVTSGTRFCFRMTAENLTDPDIKLLAQLLEIMEQGNLAVGGMISRGLGQVRLCDIKICGGKLTGKDLIKHLLLQGKEQALSIQDLLGLAESQR